MKKTISMAARLITVGALYFGFSTLAFAACTNATPCTWTLYAKPTTNEIHLTYGDTLVLTFNGNQVRLIPNAANWASGPSGGIPLQSTVIYDPEGDPTDPQRGWIIPAWTFSFKAQNDHVPDDKDHLKALLYKDPSNDEWKITAEHSDGSTHGGAAHMTD